MRILFCMTTYELFSGRCSSLAGMLIEDKHTLRVVVHGGKPDGRFDTHVCDWPNFEMNAITEFNPDLIIVWNGKFTYIHGAVHWLRARYNVKVMELGWYTQKTSSYLLDELAQISPLAKVPYIPGVCSSEGNQRLLEEARRQYELSCQPASENYIFVPMQLENDTQIVDTSDMFRTMTSLLGYVRMLFRDREIVVRNHPYDMKTERPSFVKNMTEHSSSLPLAVRAFAVVGINSTVLAESMLFGKFTLAMGHHVADPAIGNAFVEKAIGNLSSANLPDIAERSLKPHYEFRSLLLLNNQWDYKNPPGWVIDKIRRLDFSPRIPQK